MYLLLAACSLAIITNMNRILVDPDICNGQPVIRGTRITLRTILEFLAAGDSIEDVLEEYPTLSREDVLACLHFSAELMKHQFSLQEVA
jgi:uncharacterized protein (DUF433 family)